MQNMNWKARWIAPRENFGDVCPEYVKEFSFKAVPGKAILSVTAMGTYDVYLNGQRVSDYVLAPGWTAYETRHQYQQYDVTELLQEENVLTITVGRGWYRLRTPDWREAHLNPHIDDPAGLIAQLDWEGGCLATDETWEARESMVRFSDIYDGEEADARVQDAPRTGVYVMDKSLDCLIPQEGEEIREQDTVYPYRLFVTPKGETVVDFGQEVTGYVSIQVNAKAGDRVVLSHSEVLDKAGNFYTENYRGAKAKFSYTCKDGEQTYKPRLTFFGFRYIRLDEFPGTPKLENFRAIAVNSQMTRTGYLRCGDALLNQLFTNIIWGQMGNYLDIPTDCPQRDERMGWTGDAEVFVKAASYNYNVQKFFHKWLADMSAEQYENGGIPRVIPDALKKTGGAAWDDAAVICPWQIYMTYGDKEILSKQFPCMERYIQYVYTTSKDQYLWTGGAHFGDWLDQEDPSGNKRGSSRQDFIASAFFAYCTQLVGKIADILGKDSAYYYDLHSKIVEKFRQTYPEYLTQTEYVLALRFGLAEDPEKTAAELAEKVIRDGRHLKTGFVGTPHLLYALSLNNHTDLAYDLLLRREFPSWLFSVTQGATTIWEHWDGINAEGDFWSAEMNSFNHYAYGAVADWVYEEAAGIHLLESEPGFRRIRFAPKTDARMGWLEATIDTQYGNVRSKWAYEKDRIRYEVDTPVAAEVEIAGTTYQVKPGKHVFFSQL